MNIIQSDRLAQLIQSYHKTVVMTAIRKMALCIFQTNTKNTMAKQILTQLAASGALRPDTEVTTVVVHLKNRNDLQEKSVMYFLGTEEALCRKIANFPCPVKRSVLPRKTLVRMAARRMSILYGNIMSFNYMIRERCNYCRSEFHAEELAKQLQLPTLQDYIDGNLKSIANSCYWRVTQDLEVFLNRSDLNTDREGILKEAFLQCFVKQTMET